MTRRDLVSAKLQEHRMTQHDLAGLLGISDAYISQILDRERASRYGWLYWSERIASLLEMNHAERAALKDL